MNANRTASRNEYEVRGIVTGREGRPLRGAHIVVWWLRIRGRSQLASGETSGDGRYHLRYRIPANAAQPVTILIEATSHGLQAPLLSPRTQAAPQLVIDLHAEPQDESEWAKLVAAMGPLLEGLKLDQLVEDRTHQDIAFLAQELQKDPETIMRVAVAARLETAYHVPAPAFYAFLRQHTPAALPSPLLDASQNFTLIEPLVQRIGSLIFAMSVDTQKKTLTAAVALDLIGSQFTQQIPEWVIQLQALRAHDLLQHPYLVGHTTLGQLLDVMGIPVAKQRAFAQTLATNAQSMRSFWGTLGDGSHGFTSAEASAIEHILSVGAFVKNFTPLVTMIIQRFSAGTYKTLSDLATLSLQDWVQLIKQTGVPSGIDAAGTTSREEFFARTVYARVTRAYPTIALSSRILSGRLVPPSQQRQLVQFFQNNPSLELVKHNLAPYLQEQGEKAFAGISATDKAAVVANVRGFQRVLRITPKVDAAERLLAMGVKSATQIATLGKQPFLKQATSAGMTRAEATQVYGTALQRYSQLVSLYLKVNIDSVGVLPKAMAQVAELTDLAQQAIARDQSLETLFGSQDYCATDDCTSVLSPAAYLCDLLMWLRNQQQSGYTTLDVLDERRPDIRHLLLNCPNTEIELPYVDLVNELLADKISPPVDTLATSLVQKALVNGTAYYFVVTAVNAKGESGTSTEVSATPLAPTAAPTAPTNVVATPGNMQVTLSWNPVAGATSYNIYWATTPGVTTTTGTRVTSATNPYLQTGLTNAVTYYYIVTAVNARGESPASSQISTTPATPTTVPPAPMGVAVANGDTEATITWNAAPGATSYNIYWATTPGVTPVNGTRITGAVAPSLQTTLIDGVAYYFIVTAVNTLGESVPSSQVSATPAPPGTVPSAPTNVLATPGDAQVTLSWNPVAGATSYNIYWATTPGVTTTNSAEITGARNPKWKQTSATATTAELQAAPEYFNQGAYSILFGANYPFVLPYSAGLDELRTYLGHWKLPLWQLRQALLPLSGGTVTQRAAVAAERFAIPPHGADLITASTVLPAAVAWNTINPATDLVSVSAFLQAASLTFEQLLELLQVAWVQGGLMIEIQGINDRCEMSDMSLTPAPLDAGFLDRAHRFLRLWNATGYKMWELDLLLRSAAVGNNTLTESSLASLLTFRQLQDATSLAVDQVLAFYGDIDTAAHGDSDGTTTTSLYARIFLNPTVLSIAPDPDLDVLPVGGAIVNTALSSHVPALQAALGVSTADANILFGLTDGQLTLANLSQIYRVKSLAGAAKVAIPDLIAMAQLLNPGAASAAAAIATLFTSPAATLVFLAQATAIQQSHLGLDALTYLLTPPVATTLAMPLSASATTLTVSSAAGFPQPNFLIAIGAEVLQVTAMSGTGNTTWTVTRGQQGTTPATALAGASLGFVDGWATSTQMTEADIVSTLAAVQSAVQSIPTTLTSAISSTQTTITVASSTRFPPPNFLIAIGAEVLQVTAMSGTGNTTWTVTRGQQGTTPAAASIGAAVTPVLPSAALDAPLSASATTLTVSSAAGFPQPNFLIAIGAEVLQVTAMSGTGNTTWTVTRGQQGATPAAASIGAAVTAIGASVSSSVVAAVAANAHTTNNAGLSSDITSVILNTLQAPGAGQTLLATLSDPTFTSSTSAISSASFPDQFHAIQLFDKASVLVRAVRLVASDLRWLLANASVYGGLDFTQLPILQTQPELNLSSLLTTLLLIKLARLWTAASPQSGAQRLYDVIGGVNSGALGTETATQAALAAITGWSANTIAAFAGALGLAFPAHYTRPATYETLRILAAMATSTGATGSQLVVWGAVPPDEPTAESFAANALGALKAQQPSSDAWLALAPSLTDPIRDRRAAALQAYLIGQKDSSGHLIYGDANGLFDYFLIDTQMTSCQLTSRIVQAYIAVQIFVERCVLNLESDVAIDPNDTTWKEWEWRSRYRVWEANREVFLYPENWLIESLRPNRTEIYQKLEQEARQGQLTKDYLETVVLNYIDRIDGLAHLRVTGTCEDPTSGDIYVVARTLADPPVFYYREYTNGAWSGWIHIPLDIKAHQAVPALYRGRLCLFWPTLKVASEPRQNTGVAQQSMTQANQEVAKYVSIQLQFSLFRNGTWAPAQATKGELFDIPILASSQVSHTQSVEALYTLKVQSAPSPSGSTYAPSLYIDVFRLGDYPFNDLLQAWIDHFKYVRAITTTDPSTGNPTPDYSGASDALSAFLADLDTTVTDGERLGAIHLGRAVFDGQFGKLELNNAIKTLVPGGAYGLTLENLLKHAQQTYGHDARPLLPLDTPDPPLVSDSSLLPEAGALATGPADLTQGSTQNMTLDFTSTGALDQNAGALLKSAPIPLRVVGPVTDLSFDPSSYFFMQDSQRCYWVEGQKFYWTGSTWSSVVPSNPASVPYEVRYWFHPFYHPFTRLFWHQLAGGGFNQLYNPNLQQNPDQIDPSGADVFSFNSAYAPTWRVRWDLDDVTGADRQFLDFRRDASYAVYNWELFYHIPTYVAQLLSQNQQFEDARAWFHFVFNPTLRSADPTPQRFWLPKPLRNLTATQILGQQINTLLDNVNRDDPQARHQVDEWRANPFNPFLLADLRLGVPYMKSTVMSYLDNLIAWADKLFSSESREALSEATLLYIVASEILGPKPTAITPPKHADESFDQLEPTLDAFANSLVEIENVIGAAGDGSSGTSGGVSGGDAGGIPLPYTFYFKIPPNSKLLGYWSTVASRLNNLRHCQSITGAPLQLALFDAPIDPGLLIAAQAAGADLSSVLSSIFAPLPNYRFTALYPVALDFVNAVRAYGAALQAALEKRDAGELALLQQTLQQQLLTDGNQILDWQIDQAQHNIEALEHARALAQQKYNFSTTQPYMNIGESIVDAMQTFLVSFEATLAVEYAIAGIAAGFPDFVLGAAGFGGSPTAHAQDGGSHVSMASQLGAQAIKEAAAAIDVGTKLATAHGSYDRRQDKWVEDAAEAQIQIDQATAQIASANLALQIAQLNQTLHQEQIDNLQQQIDLLNTKFTADSLYNWMAGSLSATYFQSYQLAYQMCKAVERCYQFELGIQSTSFVQFGYWDSLYKGLLAGETLNHDLRRMQSSYLQENARRYELSRYVSLGQLNPSALRHLLVTGTCDFSLPEALFDNDYPGHYNRRLTRVSVTVVYPSPGKFDNVKAALTLTANRVRVSTDTTPGYAENTSGPDSRFTYNYAAVPQKIALGNAQDDPGLFQTALSSNLSDPRYLPFENAGVISSWRLELPLTTNEIDLSTVGDVVLHLYYTALDGGSDFQQTVEDYNATNQPTSGVKVFSAQNDFSAPLATATNPYPLTPWQAFIAPATAPNNQALTLSIAPSKFPAWTRGKTISVTSITVLTLSWLGGTSFTLAPQAPLPTSPITLSPVTGVTALNVCSGTISLPPNTPLGTWTFELQKQSATDFRSLTKNDIGDVLLLVNYQVS